MEHSGTERNDSKLLLVIGSVITIGAIGWAVLAGLSSRVETSDISRDAPAGQRLQPEPALFNKPAVPTPAEIETVSLELPVESDIGVPRFEISQGENVIATGLEAFAAREFDRASAYFGAETKARPTHAWAHYMLGLSKWKSGRLDEAVTAMEMAVELNSQSIKSRLNLSRILNASGRYADALEAAEAALAIDASHPTALFMQGRSLYNLDRTDEAVVALERSLAFDSENGHVYNLLGLIGIESAHFGEAVAHLELAAGYVNDAAYIQNNLGIALERTGNNAAALTAYRRAVEIDPTSDKAQVNLARLEPLVGPEHADPEVLTGQPELDVAVAGEPVPADPLEDGPDEAGEGAGEGS